MEELTINVSQYNLECLSRTKAKVLFSISFGADMPDMEVLKHFMELIEAQIINIMGGLNK